MRNQRAFTVIELLVVISIIAVLVGILFPTIGAVRRHAKQTENSTKVRGLIQAMVQSGESRRGFLPGFDGFSFTRAGLTTTGDALFPGQTVEARYWITLNGNYTDGEALVSPQDNKDPWTTGNITANNYSYSMLKIATDNNLDPLLGRNIDLFRRGEWSNKQHAKAPIVSDRLTRGPGNTVQAASQTDAYQSIHDGSSPGNWLGSVGFGDVHVEFFKTPLIDTRIAGYANSVDTTGQDDLFAQLETSAGPADINKNAAMVYQGFDNPVGPAN